MRSRLGLSAALFPQVLSHLKADETTVEEGSLVRLPQHRATLSATQEKTVEGYLKALESEPYAPPTDATLDPELLALMVNQGQVVKVDRREEKYLTRASS